MEIVAEASPTCLWPFDLLQETDIHFPLAQPKRLSAMFGRTCKRDGVDAKHLARVREDGPIPEAHPRPTKQRRPTALLSNRPILVGLRTISAARTHSRFNSIGPHLARYRPQARVIIHQAGT